MEADIEGWVRNSEEMLKKHGPFSPIFEAVVNSIQSINERKLKYGDNFDGKITIKLEREQTLIKNNNLIPNLKNVIIEDNGIGFDDTNYKSFRTGFTTHKSNIGGKGLGRFSFLVAFDKAFIQSNSLHEENSFKKRSFDFVPVGEGFVNETLENSEDNIFSTSINLENFKIKKFKKNNNMHKRAITIARRIMQHCALTFISQKAPKILLYDSNEDECIDINELWKEEVECDSKTRLITIGEHQFIVTLLKLSNSDEDRYEIRLCGDDREVCYDNLHKYIPEIPKDKKLNNPDPNSQKKIILSIYVSGEYLNKNLNQSRDGFNFDDLEEENLFEGLEISKSIIYKEASNAIKTELHSYFGDLRRKNYEKNIEHIKTTPRYYILQKDEYRERLESIPYSLSEKERDIELYKIINEIEEKIQEDVKYFSKGLKNVSNLSEFRDKTKQIASLLTEANKSTLAEYISHRKILLDLLEQNRKLYYDEEKDKERYKLEENIHELIFPMKKTSKEVRFEDHNLWVIDETLAFHQYLASDLQHNQIEKFETTSEDRMDMVIFQDSMLTSSSNGDDVQSITIIEFKRPARDDYQKLNLHYNPHEQALKYLGEIREKGFKTNRGIFVSGDRLQKIPIYIYIIADMMPSLEKVIRSYGNYKFHLDKQDGAFVYLEEFNAYIEIISYKKLISNAVQRNKAFFEKLRLPNINVFEDEFKEQYENYTLKVTNEN